MNKDHQAYSDFKEGVNKGLDIAKYTFEENAEKFSLSYFSTSPTGSENHLASFRFQNTFLLNVWNRNGDRWFSDPVGEVLK